MNFNDFHKINLNKSFLLKIKHKALRLKIWYRLNNIERAIIDLTIKCVNKIKEAIENEFLNKIYENGVEFYDY